MSDSSYTSAINNKKEKKNTSNKGNSPNISGFISSVILIFIAIIVYYSGSGLLLYVCKLAQSNILPTDKNCSPYTETKPDIQPIQTNIFATNDDEPLSMKIKFPYDSYNSKNYILDMIREYKNDSNSNFLGNYIISMVETIIQFNYSVFNNILNLLNGLPEIIVVIFGPMIVPFILTTLYIVDHFYLIYLWFANMSWFFKTNTNKTSTGKPNWEAVTLTSPFLYWCAIYLVILFSILFFYSMPFISIVSTLAMYWCTFSCVTYKAEMVGKTITVLPIIKDVFKYYKSTIMGAISFFVIISAFFNLGKISGIFSMITLVFIYFGIISIDLFNPINKTNLSPLVSYEQAKKTCNFSDSSNSKHGFLYNLFFGQKGGSITKELKSIQKKISSE
jgi:hypothetical protein